jgi:hypothetical protein
MARGRMISKSLATSKRFKALNAIAGPNADFCKAIYPLLVAHTDDHGRMDADAETINMVICPTFERTDHEVEVALQYLAESELIDRYKHGGGIYLQVNNFEEHQQGLHRRTASKFPESPGTSRNFREIPVQEKGRELNGTELKGTEQNESAAAAPLLASTGFPQPAPNPEEFVPVLTELVKKEILPLRLATEGDITEATKAHARKHKIPFNGQTVRKAVESAMVQRARFGPPPEQRARTG